jgi:hypothetical protein
MKRRHPRCHCYVTIINESTASADEMIYIHLLKSIRNDAKTAKQFNGCLEAVYLRYLGQKSKRQIILESRKNKLNKEKSTLEQKESHESLMSNFEENVLRFYCNILKENLICN